MSALKSQMFFAPAQYFFEHREKVVDKPVYLCLNVNNKEKDFDGKFVLSDVLPESRWLVKTGVDGKADLIPESVL